MERIDESNNASSTEVEEISAYGVTSNYLGWFGDELAKKFPKRNK